MAASSRRSRLLLVVALGLSACRAKKAQDVAAREVMLEREIDTLKALVGTLERQEPLVPEGDAMVTIDDTLVKDLLAAELPYEADIHRFHLSLTGADVQFHGSPIVELRGDLSLRERPSLKGSVALRGSIEDILLDQGSGTLKARLAIERLSVESAAGIESILGDWTLERLATVVRDDLSRHLPLVEIPVTVRESLEFPGLKGGPVRMGSAQLPLKVTVSRVLAAQGRLLIGLHVEPGEVRPKVQGA